MTSSLTDIKSDIAWRLRELIGDDRFELWFSPEQSFQILEDVVVVRTLDEFSLSFVRQQFESSIRQSVDAVLGHTAVLRFESQPKNAEAGLQRRLFSDEDASEADDKKSRKACPPTVNNSAIRRNSEKLKNENQSPNGESPARNDEIEDKASKRKKTRPCLNEFQFGTENEILRTAVKELLEYPGKFNPLVLYGPVGCGKTHLIQALVNHSRSCRTYKKCFYMTAEQFTSNFVQSLAGRGLTTFRSKYRNLDLFAIDDIQFLSGKRATLVEFQNTVETLLRTERQIVLTADRPLHELNFLGNELITRLSCGLSCPVQYPDLMGRAQIVRRLAKDRELELEPSIERFVAERIVRDVRLLSGAINRLKVAGYGESDPLTLDQAKKILSDILQSQQSVVSMAEIEQVVCDVCGVNAAELKSSKRVKKISTARMLAMWLSRKHTSAALSEIGNYYGGRTHSTVVAAEKKINRLLNAQEEIELQTHRCNINNAIGRIEYNLNVS